MSTPWPLADRPDAEGVRRRQQVVEATARGDATAVRTALADDSDRVRASAVRGLAELGELTGPEASIAARDSSARVRRALAEAAAALEWIELRPLIDDPDASVCETACWAAGERAETATPLVSPLARVSADHPEPLCREAAVAAMGAIGDPGALPAILAATGDRATVRRRAVLALAPFDTPEVTAALERALGDRDWQVRQAAEDLLS